ncbi:cytochrome bd-I oxidase subunit CydX [Rhizobium soli]|jgi:cyd operon protein YbgT|uniref:Cyd operon protein YbgT n=1 Tax=Rhizobium soli TaxID=424798 RepID=A0A7X0MV96_9HYPH|nr:cytochrome bd-I oxidase subunit CydX [Rhizobium soli]MBB6510198.1 cyd operon protein YbgT [Rhizobium soli]RYE65762.1 MAG: cytochrome bd-I oxidase subunit CydX [Rhizobiaceae bacterium]
MWYFSWILGVGLACVFAILNAMWFEMKEDRRLSALPDPSNKPKRSSLGDPAA